MWPYFGRSLHVMATELRWRVLLIIHIASSLSVNHSSLWFCPYYMSWARSMTMPCTRAMHHSSNWKYSRDHKSKPLEANNGSEEWLTLLTVWCCAICCHLCEVIPVYRCVHCRDAHRSKLYDMIHITILIYNTDTLTILITILQGINWLSFLQCTKNDFIFRNKMYSNCRLISL